MKKIYKVEVDCANCANKIQDAISKLEGVNEVNINFMTQKMILDLEENAPKDIIKIIKKTGKKVDSDFEILE